MDRPVVVPAQTEPVKVEEDVRLWAAPPMPVVTQFVAGVVARMAFGVAGSLRFEGRMVRRHLETCGADRPVS